MKKAIKITLICLGAIVTLFLLRIGLIVFAIGGEHLLVKWHIDNPYVDSRFSGWEEVTIDGFGAFSLPQDWSVTQDGIVYTILDDAGNIWAYGGISDRKSSTSGYTDISSFLYEVYSVKPTLLSTDFVPAFIMMKGSDMYKNTFDFAGTEKAFYTIYLSKNMYTNMVWLCPSDLMEQPKQYAIAEAMVYSYAFAYAVK